MPDQLTRGAPFLCIASTGCNSGEVADFRSEWWPVSDRNGGRHQIGIPGRLRVGIPGRIESESARYDGTVFPAARPSFLRRWIRQPQGVAFGVYAKERLQGYGVLRACRRGFKIGPLFADDSHIADTLFQGLASRVPGQPIFLDTPEANPAAIKLAKRHGMEPVFETARMYTKGLPPGQIDRCFGVTTFELG